MLVSLLLMNVAFAEWGAPDDPYKYDWQNSPISDMSPSQVQQYAQYIPPERISEINDPTARDSAIKTKWNLASSNIGGSSFTISGNTLTVSGSTIDLSTMQGKSIAANPDGTVSVDGQKLRNGHNVKIDNKDNIVADNMGYFDDSLHQFTCVNCIGLVVGDKGASVTQADTLTLGPNAFTNVQNFRTSNWKQYQMDRSDLIIVETSRIEATRNTELIIENNKMWQ